MFFCVIGVGWGGWAWINCYMIVCSFYIILRFMDSIAYRTFMDKMSGYVRFNYYLTFIAVFQLLLMISVVAS